MTKVFYLIHHFNFAIAIFYLPFISSSAGSEFINFVIIYFALYISELALLIERFAMKNFACSLLLNYSFVFHFANLISIDQLL